MGGFDVKYNPCNNTGFDANKWNNETCFIEQGKSKCGMETCTEWKKSGTERLADGVEKWKWDAKPCKDYPW